MRRKGRPESEERRINSENIAGGFPHYILHRHRCNLPLISVPRWLTKAIFCSQLRVGDRGGGQGRFGRSGWRVEDGERKRRCCGGGGVHRSMWMPGQACISDSHILAETCVSAAERMKCRCCWLQLRVRHVQHAQSAQTHHSTGPTMLLLCKQMYGILLFFFFFCSSRKKQKTGGTLKMDNLEYSTIPSGRHLSRHSKGPLYWLLWASKMTFTATAVNKLDKGWYFAKAAARKRHRTELNAFKSGSTWRTRIMWAKTHGVEKACTVTGA